jgi:GntR family transcriptional regulator, rspAB operon transcriptional repressor
MSSSPDPGNGLGTEAVYQRVREAILDGEIAPGATMSQVSLAEELGISRTPLREALRMLQTEGLVDAERNRRVRVAAVSPRDLEELCVLRVTLEAEAIRLAVPRMTAEHLARLEGFTAEMAHFAQVEDYRRWTVPHQAFHRALIAPAGERFTAVLGQLFDHAERYRRMHIGHGPSAWATKDHRAILNACKAGDRDAAGRRLAQHLARTAFELVEHLEPGYEPALLRETLADVSENAAARR